MGGDPLWAATQAAIGYVSNQASGMREYAGVQNEHDRVRSYRDRQYRETSGFDPMVNNPKSFGDINDVVKPLVCTPASQSCIGGFLPSCFVMGACHGDTIGDKVNPKQ